jgi:serine protease Do
MPSVVGLRIGPGAGSGVIISADGYVLTAGHVSGKPDQKVSIILADGRKVNGKTLGNNRGMDSGLIKITDEGKWPYVEMGESSPVQKGLWCLAIGHPGGVKTGRTPVVRLGRVLNPRKARLTGMVLMETDCVLVGGDSGGPLFDMHGKVIGIHSQIGPNITMNMHVPVDTYRETWEHLAASEAWNSPGKPVYEPYLGVEPDIEADNCKIRVKGGTPAEKAGLKSNDVVTKFAGTRVANFEELRTQINKRRPGDQVVLEIRRGDETITLDVTIGKRPPIVN